MKNSPCFQCGDRKIGCHGHCEREQAFLEETHNIKMLISSQKYSDFEASEYEALRNVKAKLRK